MRILSIGLLAIGLILIIAGIVFATLQLSFIGGIMMVLGIALLIPAILRKEEIIDNWSILIENAQGKADNIFTDTEGFVKESKAPGLRIERQKLAPGVIKGILGVKRDFLVVTLLDNPRLEPFKLFLNARDYGNNLDVSWYVTYKPGPLRLRKLAADAIVGGLDLFDQQDLRAYVTNAHHCLLKAVEKLMVSLNQDPSKMERKSRGFLGIS